MKNMIDTTLTCYPMDWTIIEFLKNFYSKRPWQGMHMYNLIGLRQVYVRSVFNICEGNESLLRWFQTQDSIGQTSLHRILFGYMLPWRVDLYVHTNIAYRDFSDCEHNVPKKIWIFHSLSTCNVRMKVKSKLLPLIIGYVGTLLWSPYRTNTFPVSCRLAQSSQACMVCSSDRWTGSANWCAELDSLIFWTNFLPNPTRVRHRQASPGRDRERGRRNTQLKKVHCEKRNA